MSYSDNSPANNIIVPASVVEAAIAAFAADRASQRSHEAAMLASICAFTVTAAERILGFAKEEAATRRADRTAEHLSLIESLSSQVQALNAQVEKLQADNDRLSRQRPLRAEG